jgi:glycosyltransferase involved in cell wall biosynthesis
MIFDTVSIIIPTRNRAQKLRRCLDSIAAQTFQDFEVIVVNDAGDDNTDEVVQPYRAKMDLEYIRLSEQCGPGGARNHGIAAASGRWLIFIDDDDWIDPEYIEGAVKEIRPGYNLLYPETLRFHKGPFEKWWVYPATYDKWDMIAEEYEKRCARIPFGGSMVLRSFWLECEPFEKNAACCDWSWKVKHWTHIWPYCFIPQGDYHLDVGGADRVSNRDRDAEKQAVLDYIQKNYAFALDNP